MSNLEEERLSKLSTEELLSEWRTDAVLNLRKAFGYRRIRKYLPYGFPRHLVAWPMSEQATEEELCAAEVSVYAWWWRFLKESPDYPPSSVVTQDQQKIVDLHKDFGDLGESFRDWWRTVGREVFSEPHGPAVRVFMDEQCVDHDAFPNVLILEIELRLPKEDILAELDNVISEAHPGNRLKPRKYTKARRSAAEGKKDDFSLWPQYLKVWHQTRKHPPDKRVWAMIGRELGDKQPVDTELARKIEGQYERAEQLIYHAARGIFPCTDPLGARPTKKRGRPKKGERQGS